MSDVLMCIVLPVQMGQCTAPCLYKYYLVQYQHMLATEKYSAIVFQDHEGDL